MDALELYEMFKRQSFQPARIHLSDGSHYDIKHPEQIMVTRRWSYVGLGGNGEGPFQDNAVVDNAHVTRIEPLTPKRRSRKS